MFSLSAMSVCRVTHGDELSSSTHRRASESWILISHYSGFNDTSVRKERPEFGDADWIHYTCNMEEISFWPAPTHMTDSLQIFLGLLQIPLEIYFLLRYFSALIRPQVLSPISEGWSCGQVAEMRFLVQDCCLILCDWVRNSTVWESFGVKAWLN